MHPLETLFWPRSVAVLGASPDPHRVRGRLFRNVRDNPFAGRIVPVNPSYSEIDGLTCYPTLAAIGEPIDLALMAIPASHVAAAIADCAKAGVRNVVIISSGFAEQGDAQEQQQLAAIARDSGLRILGPNCEGFFNLPAGLAATFSPTAEPTDPTASAPTVSARRLGVIAQSGGIGFALFARGRAAGLTFSTVVSTGNESDLTAADVLEYMVQDDRTEAVLLFCEAVRDSARFIAALAEARQRRKPVIAIKVGGSEAGQRAAVSHTASLSGWQAAYRAVFARYGIIEADDPDEAVAIAGVLTTCPLPTGRRVGVVTVSGGGGAWMADTLAAQGLSAPILSMPLQASLRRLMPSYGASQNPVDVTAQGANSGPAMLSAAEQLAASDEIDMVVLITSLASPQRVSLDPARLREFAERYGKPVAIWTYTPPSALGRKRIAESGLFLHVGLRACCVALSRLAAYAEYLVRPAPNIVVPAPVHLPPGLPRVLTEYRARALLAPYGLPGQPEHLAHSAGEAAEIAAGMGYPVALKIQSPDIAHKTEAGGVALGLADAAAVRHAWTSIMDAVSRRVPGAAIEGVLVQRMAPPGYELVVGMVNDATFGPIMMLGWGGTAVEVMGDVVHSPAPIDGEEAMRMIRGLRSTRLLGGFRGAPATDVTPLVELVTRLSDAALALREAVQEMEFNPVILHADGSGLTVADALVTLRA